MFKPILAKVHDLLKKFSYSLAAKEELRKWTSKALIFACPTRWWSLLNTVQRVLDIHDENPAAFKNVCQAMDWDEKKLTLDQDDLLLIRKYLEFFTEFKRKSEILGGESYSNVHLVFPFVTEMFEHIKSFDDDPLIGSFSKPFLEIFNVYFGFIVDPEYHGIKYNFEPYYMVSAFLSPVFNNGLTAQQRDIAKKYLLSEVKRMDAVQTPVSQEAPRQSVSFKGLKHFFKNTESSARSSDNHTLVERKFNRDMDAFEIDCDSKFEEMKLAANQTIKFS